MPDQNTNQGAAPTAPVQVPASDGAPPAQGSAPRSDEPLRNIGEVVELKKDVRAIKEGYAAILAKLDTLGTQAAKPKQEPAQPAPDASANDAMAELAFRDALDDFEGPRPSKGQRALLRDLYRVQKPADVGAWLTERVAQLGIAPAPGSTAAPTPPASPSSGQAPAAPAAPAPAQSNSGPPGTSRAPVLGSNPHTWDPAVIRSMNDEDFAKHVDAWRRQSGNANPYKRAGEK